MLLMNVIRNRFFFMIKIDFCNKNVKKKIARLDRKIHGFLGVVNDFFNFFFSC